MTARQNLKMVVLLSLALLVVFVSACSSPAPAAQQPAAPTAAPQEPTAPPEPTALPPTNTPEPTATLPPTVTPLPPTATLEPTATVLPEPQMTGWCLPKEIAITQSNADFAAAMPEGARASTLENDTVVLLTPASTCAFVFTLGVPVQPGMTLEVLDTSNVVWLTLPVDPMPEKANQGYALTRHSYIVEPPFWTVTYTMRSKDASRGELWSSKVEMRRDWRAEKCWDGTMPNPITRTCKKQQDLHPWDPAYTPPPPAAP